MSNKLTKAERERYIYQNCLQLDEIFPSLGGNPLKRLLAFTLLQRKVTLEQEVKFSSIQLAIAVQNTQRKLERKHILVLLKDTHTRVVVRQRGQQRDDVVQFGGHTQTDNNQSINE